MHALIAWTVLASGLPAQEFQERKVAVLPSEVITEVLFAPDGTAAACSVKSGEKWVVVRGDWTSKPYELAFVSGLSQDGNHVSYVAAEGPGGNAAYLDGKIIQKFDIVRGEDFRGGPILSGDGSTTVQVLSHRKEGWYALSINGKIGKRYKGMLSSPAVSFDGKATACIWDDSEGDWYCVMDDRLSPKYEDVLAPVLSANGKVVAYIGGMLNPTDKYFLHVDDRKTALDFVPKSVFISADGKAVGLVAKVKFGNDVRRENQTDCIVVDGKRSGEYRWILNAVFDPSGKKVAFRAYDDRSEPIVVVQDRVHPAKGIVSGPVFSKDGKRVGYGARIGRELWWKVFEAP